MNAHEAFYIQCMKQEMGIQCYLGCVSTHSSDGSTNLLKSINTEPTENDHILYFNLLEPFTPLYSPVQHRRQQDQFGNSVTKQD